MREIIALHSRHLFFAELPSAESDERMICRHSQRELSYENYCKFILIGSLDGFGCCFSV
ncbi:hypothetical protein [Thalassospira xiamenensis]|uniref:Uncharacterized protein n=1 Tax=Thalassospira xiamenensis TaxID=220697 RepID=A0A285TEG3_9PROT|nr:hypothetical protein [Thalassospira xiamenensis]SOC20327.1 hypothetical protein SAMN05428964_10354 [Thalassospira xiamenensis]